MDPEFIEELRQKYIKNPPEDDLDDDGFEEGFYIF